MVDAVTSIIHYKHISTSLYSANSVSTISFYHVLRQISIVLSHYVEIFLVLASFNSPHVRQAKREKQSRLALEEFWTWCSDIDALRTSPLRKAVGYATGQKQILGCFLPDGCIPIFNIPDENTIRPFVMGRKNWLFCNTRKGAAASASVYSIVGDVKVNGMVPYKYLKHMLKQMPRVGRRHSCGLLELLAPWNPQIQEPCRSLDIALSSDRLRKI